VVNGFVPGLVVPPRVRARLEGAWACACGARTMQRDSGMTQLLTVGPEQLGGVVAHASAAPSVPDVRVH